MAQRPEPLGGAPQSGPSADPQTPVIRAVRISETILVDGVLDEGSWSQAAPSTTFLQKDPQEGAPATEGTQVRLLFDARNLYIAVLCHDSNPSGIRATELRRDQTLESDDVFELILDTLHDHRSAYLFRINPLGTLHDATITNEGQVVNTNWSEKWSAAARITEQGWSAEIQIPFKTIRFTAGEEIVWGINFHRTIKRKNEDVFWTAHNRNYKFEEVSRSGHLQGLSEIQGFTMRVKPFFTTGASKTVEDGVEDTEHLTDAGIEDAKFMLTPRLALDLTVNPDFAQADVDEAQVNLSRFDRFFPEQREFFQEGSGIFEFGIPGEFFRGPELLLFNSRRIGLSDNRREIPIYGGLKLTGKQGPFDIGLLNMQTRRSNNDLAGQNFSVARVKMNVLSRSYLGGIFTRSTAGATGSFNRTAGTDASFTFLENLNIAGLLAWNDAPLAADDEWSGHAKVEWDSDRFNFKVAQTNIQENFLPGLGFVQRAEEGWKGIQHSTLGGAYRPRPGIPLVRQFEFAAFVDYFANQEGLLDTREWEAGWTTEFESGEEFAVEYSRNFERLLRPNRRLGLRPGDYAWHEVRIALDTFRGRPLSASTMMFVGEFYNGTATRVDVSLEFRPSPNLSLEPGISLNRISLPGAPSFTTKESNAQVNYSFSQKWLTRTTFVLNSQDKEYGLNVRLNYIFRPEDDLFIVYNETRTYGDGGGLVNRALIAKMTYSFDF